MARSNQSQRVRKPTKLPPKIPYIRRRCRRRIGWLYSDGFLALILVCREVYFCCFVAKRRA